MKILFPIELLKNMVNEIGKDDKTYLKKLLVMKWERSVPS